MNTIPVTPSISDRYTQRLSFSLPTLCGETDGNLRWTEMRWRCDGILISGPAFPVCLSLCLRVKASFGRSEKSTSTTSLLRSAGISCFLHSKPGVDTTTHPTSPLRQLHRQLIPHRLLHLHIPLTMFRNALRQSSRTVGALSASGRVAAVCTPTTHPNLVQLTCDRS